jgi:Domain of Unknown Function (DUF928)
MPNFQCLFLGGILITAVTSFPALAMPLAAPNSTAQQPSHPIAGTSTATASIDSFMQTFIRRRSKTPGISRSGGICPISPGLVETDQVWSDRPLFIWQGAVAQIQLRQLGSREVLWSQAIDPQSRSVAYSGAALQPGQIYQWELVGEANANTSSVFQVMVADQRLPIATHLQELEARSQASSQSQEAIAIQQAQYFLDQNLWSDALQALYAIDRPSPKMAQSIQQIESMLCGDRVQGGQGQ